MVFVASTGGAGAGGSRVGEKQSGLGTATADRSSRERAVAAAFVAAGLLAAAVAAPLNRFFLSNFAFCWAPQALMLGALLPFKPRPAIVAGTALALTVYFVAFDGWIHSLPPREAMAWLFYPMGFPGAIVGAVSAMLIARRRPLISAMRAGFYAAALTAAGVALMPAGLALERYGRFRWW